MTNPRAPPAATTSALRTTSAKSITLRDRLLGMTAQHRPKSKIERENESRVIEGLIKITFDSSDTLLAEICIHKLVINWPLQLDNYCLQCKRQCPVSPAPLLLSNNHTRLSLLVLQFVHYLLLSTISAIATTPIPSPPHQRSNYQLLHRYYPTY